MIYAKQDIELGDEITYGMFFCGFLLVYETDYCFFFLKIIIFRLSKTRFLVCVALSSVVGS